LSYASSGTKAEDARRLTIGCDRRASNVPPRSRRLPPSGAFPPALRGFRPELPAAIAWRARRVPRPRRSTH